MFTTKLAAHVFACLICHWQFAEQDISDIVKSETPIVESLEQVLDGVYIQSSDKRLHSLDVWYTQNAPGFPPMKFHLALDGEDRLRGLRVEDGNEHIVSFIDGRSTIYASASKTALIRSGKETIQDACNYLTSLGIALSDERRAIASSLFPETLQDKSLEWSLASEYWIVSGHPCIKLTNKLGEVYLVDPKIGYSIRWKKIDVTVAFSDFRTIDGKWMPFRVEISGYANVQISVESVAFRHYKPLGMVLPPGTMVSNEIDSESYFLDANGKRQDIAGVIDEAKRVVPGSTSNRWLIVMNIGVLVAVCGYIFLTRKKGH